MTRSNPFPGMNPWLEEHWPGVHSRLVAYLADAIAVKLPDRSMPFHLTVIQTLYHSMKAGRRKQEARTATVRELRNRFADVAKWIADGEEVTILRGGIVFATLAPPTAAAAPAVDWAARFEKRPPGPAKRKLTAEETQAFYDEMKGSL